MDRAAALFLLHRRVSGRRASSRLRAQLRHRDPSGHRQHHHRPHLRRHFRPRVGRCRVRDQHPREKRAALTSLIRFNPLARRFQTRNRAQERCTVPTILIRRYQGARR
jgi:hypothetical protein